MKLPPSGLQTLLWRRQCSRAVVHDSDFTPHPLPSGPVSRFSESFLPKTKSTKADGSDFMQGREQFLTLAIRNGIGVAQTHGCGCV